MRDHQKKHVGLAVRRARVGWLFVLPFLIGFFYLFLSPLLLYFRMSFSEIQPGNQSILFEYVGFSHYRDILFVRQNFIKDVFSVSANC